MDQDDVRGGPRWHRHITLAMLAHGFLAWQRREAGENPTADLGVTDGMVPLRVPQARRLLALTLPVPPHAPAFALAWAHGRRRHQGTDKRAHYQQEALSLVELTPP